VHLIKLHLNTAYILFYAECIPLKLFTLLESFDVTVMLSQFIFCDNEDSGTL